MNVYCGVDLAWKDTNPSGITLLKHKDNKLHIQKICLAQSDKEILTHCEKATVIAIDAPLIIPQEDKDRTAEKQLQRDYQKRGVGVYPAHKKWLKKVGGGRIRGQDLLQELRKKGYTANPERKQSVVETYPAAIHVALFNLHKPLPYKYKKGRTKKQCHNALLHLQRLLNTKIKTSIGIVPKPCQDTTLKHLKKAEDKLDSILCAYTAYLLSTNKENTIMYGDVNNGYIITPNLQEITTHNRV